MNVPGNQFDENLSWKENSKFLENKTAKNIAKDSLLALHCSYSHCYSIMLISYGAVNTEPTYKR